VSPQNILISFEGEVKLTDFGIAKAATKASQTERGALRGKLLYMSPEQAWGKPIDRRSDVFSLGIVLYEMLTGQKPFLGQSEISILEMVRECRVAPPGSLNPRIPERLEAVVVKALDREPDHRYQDAGEMARDLERALPERKLPGSAELARLMEILFEPGERREAVGSEHTSGKHLVARRLEVDLPAAPQSPPRVAAQDMSIDKLLKRFGIK
jgi:serine/threonine protein kinase